MDERILIVCFMAILHLTFSKIADVNSFPNDFLLGFATASYQIEGAWKEDGKGENIWDRFTHQYPNLVVGGTNGDVAADSYHKYKEDVALLKDLGAQVYRFSLSWSRILPTGDIDVINQSGIDYYNHIIDELIFNGIQPMVTLYHWDLPQSLENIGGWSNPLLADYFEEYSRIAFKYFGDRVKWWITFNEPLEFCLSGYGNKYAAPAVDMPGIADYLCGHTVLISHARAYHVYDREFRQSLNVTGKIGITLNGGWNEPLSNHSADRDAAETTMQFQVGWFAHPILLGNYPPVMRVKIDAKSKSEGRIRSRLPVFDIDSINYVKGTADFLGINHYTTVLAADCPSPPNSKPYWMGDAAVCLTVDPTWPGSASSWLKVVPWGFRKQLNWLKKSYNNVPVFVTENGFSDKGEMDDTDRINYYKDYIKEMFKAINTDKCNVIGYIAWSLIDNFEWLDGFSARFGIYHVDFTSPNRTRTAKSSASFFRKLLSMRTLPHIKEKARMKDGSNFISNDQKKIV